jgi:predicted phosphoribosyltransferase
MDVIVINQIGTPNNEELAAGAAGAASTSAKTHYRRSSITVEVLHFG